MPLESCGRKQARRKLSVKDSIVKTAVPAWSSGGHMQWEVCVGD